MLTVRHTTRHNALVTLTNQTVKSSKVKIGIILKLQEQWNIVLAVGPTSFVVCAVYYARDQAGHYSVPK